MKHSKVTALVAVLLMLTVSACAKQKEEENLNVNPESSSLEGGITSLDAIIDDQAGSAFAAYSKPSTYEYAEKLFSLAVPQAYAVSCMRAFDQGCNAGVKTYSTSSCDLPRGVKFSGFITLTYSNASCSMASTGDFVNRTYDYDISGPYGGAVLSVTSEGGGGKLTKTAGGWSAEILGKKKILTWRNREVMNLNISTPQAIEITGTLGRANRFVNSGQLQVVHNLAGFTALYEPVNLTYKNSCCHPIAGSLNVTYSGSITGSGSVTFNGCGSATIVRNGQSQDVTLNYCE